MDTTNVPIVVAFTPNYLIPACVSMLSVLNSADPQDQFHFICLQSEPLDRSSRESLQKTVGKQAEISFIDMDSRLNHIYVIEKYTIAASYRLLIPELLPQYDKVLYMDCDMIIQNNVAELFRETDLADNYMAGVMEATLPEQEDHLSVIKCKPGEYVNSGFLLMNLKSLRADNMVEKFLKASENDKLEFPDQDVINMICKGKLLALPPFWNSIRTFLLPQYKNLFLRYYTESAWQYVQNSGNVHYTGSKPWNTFTVGFGLWWSHYEMLPRSLKMLDKIPRHFRLLAKVYNTKLGGKIIDNAQKVYRLIKKRI